MTPLEQYIEAQIKNGYSKSQIKQYLIQQGYKEKDIDVALKDLDKLKTQTQVKQPISPAQVQPTQNQEKLIKTQLISYVLTYLQKGYQVDQLFNYLKNQGYNEKTLKEVFKQINTQYYHGQMQSSIIHEHTLSTKTIMKVGVMFLFVFLLLGGIYFASQGLIGGGKDKLLDVKATPLKEKLTQGDTLAFEVDLINQGSKGRVDVNLDYIVRDASTKIIIKEQDTRALETSMQFQKKLSLPDLETGLYRVQVIATYEGKVAVSTFTFSYQASEKEKPPEIPKVSPEEQQKTEDQIAGEIPKEEILETPTAAKDAKGQDDQDIFDFAVNQDDKTSALSYCAGINGVDLESECYFAISQKYKDSQVCDLIKTLERKEDCYMNFVMSGNEDNCDKVTLPKNQQLCKDFIYLAKMKSYFEENDTQGLQDYLDIPEYQEATEEDVQAHDPPLDDFSIGDFVN